VAAIQASAHSIARPGLGATGQEILGWLVFGPQVAQENLRVANRFFPLLGDQFIHCRISVEVVAGIIGPLHNRLLLRVPALPPAPEPFQRDLSPLR